MGQVTDTNGRSRLLYTIFILIVIVLGLASRRFPQLQPDFIATYAGDFLWALLVYLLFGFLFPANPPLKNGLVALSFAFAIEISQLYEAVWLNELRSNRVAALVLGRGFLWSDFVCYTAGILCGVGLETLILPPKRRAKIG